MRAAIPIPPRDRPKYEGGEFGFPNATPPSQVFVSPIGVGSSPFIPSSFGSPLGSLLANSPQIPLLGRKRSPEDMGWDRPQKRHRFPHTPVEVRMLDTLTKFDNPKKYPHPLQLEMDLTAQDIRKQGSEVDIVWDDAKNEEDLDDEPSADSSHLSLSSSAIMAGDDVDGILFMDVFSGMILEGEDGMDPVEERKKKSRRKKKKSKRLSSSMSAAIPSSSHGKLSHRKHGGTSHLPPRPSRHTSTSFGGPMDVWVGHAQIRRVRDDDDDDDGDAFDEISDDDGDDDDDEDDDDVDEVFDEDEALNAIGEFRVVGFDSDDYMLAANGEMDDDAGDEGEDEDADGDVDDDDDSDYFDDQEHGSGVGDDEYYDGEDEIILRIGLGNRVAKREAQKSAKTKKKKKTSKKKDRSRDLTVGETQLLKASDHRRKEHSLVDSSLPEPQTLEEALGGGRGGGGIRLDTALKSSFGSSSSSSTSSSSSLPPGKGTSAFPQSLLEKRPDGSSCCLHVTGTGSTASTSSVGSRSSLQTIKLNPDDDIYSQGRLAEIYGLPGRFRDYKRSLFDNHKMKKEQLDFMNGDLEHKELLCRLPHRITASQFAFRIILMGFHFALRDGRFPSFWKKLNHDILSTCLSQDQLIRFDPSVGMRSHAIRAANPGMSIAEAVRRAQMELK